MSRDHAILHKPIINLDHGGSRHVMCAWDDCERDGYELYRVDINYGKAGTPHIVHHVFCTERHLNYFVHSHLAYGKLPKGINRADGYRRA
jgi:hypothetical protein